MSDEKETFEVTDKGTGSVAVLPTREEAKEQGLTADEMDRAEKRGMISKPEDAADKAKADAEAKAKADADAKAKAEEAAKVDGGKKSDEKPAYRGTPMDDLVLTPEQEKVFLDTFGPGTPHRAMYFRAKNERFARQRVEKERDAEKKGREAEKQAREAAEARIKVLEAGKPAQELDEEGNPIDPDDKPLTLKQLREMQKQEAEAIESKKRENDEKSRVVAEAQETQEEFMRAEHPDFDDAVKLTTDLIKNLDSLIQEDWEKEEVISLVRSLQVAAAQADKIDLNRNHAARIAYRLAKYHPKYGQKADAKPNGDASEKDGKSEDPKKANGGRLTPEQMKRIEDNTHRRASSASVQGGGGTRTISADDVDAETLDKMSYSARQKFREKHPDLYAKLLRG